MTKLRMFLTTRAIKLGYRIYWQYNIDGRTVTTSWPGSPQNYKLLPVKYEVL